MDSNNASHFTQSPVDNAGNQLDLGASIRRLVQNNGVVYAAGNFSGPNIQNIMMFGDGNATGMPQGGLNSVVNSLLVFQGSLYVGGNFTDTAEGGSELNHLAVYSFGSKSWSALGGGVNGPVEFVASFPLNISTEVSETSIAVSGDFDQVLAFGDNPSMAVSGFAVWVPSRKNWLQNLDVDKFGFDGRLTAITTVGNASILAGNLTSNGLINGGAVSLHHNQHTLNLSPFSTDPNRLGEGNEIVTGINDKSSRRNLTIFGGHFTAASHNNIENLLIFNEKDNTTSGIGPGVDRSSTFLSLAVTNNTLYAGGRVTGTVGSSPLNGFVTYNLTSGKIIQPQPPHLNGGDVSVNTIAVRPDSSDIYFGGVFESAGALPCPSVCFYDASTGQWNRPGVDLFGAVLDLRWASKRKLVAVGDLGVSGNRTTVAIYDSKRQSWSSISGSSTPNIPGPVTAFTPANEDISKFWLAGQSSNNGSSFIVKYDGSHFRPVRNVGFGVGSVIRGLDVVHSYTNHKRTSLLDDNLVLLITGQLVLPSFGNVSAALFNGSSLVPFIITSSSDGRSGSISRMFSDKRNNYEKDGKFKSFVLF